MNDPSAMEPNIQLLMRAAGFTQALDPEFSEWWTKAQRSRGMTQVDDAMLIPGHDISLGEARKLSLRRKVKEACKRLYGVKDA